MPKKKKTTRNLIIIGLIVLGVLYFTGNLDFIFGGEECEINEDCPPGDICAEGWCIENPVIFRTSDLDYGAGSYIAFNFFCGGDYLLKHHKLTESTSTGGCTTYGELILENLPGLHRSSCISQDDLYYGGGYIVCCETDSGSASAIYNEVAYGAQTYESIDPIREIACDGTVVIECETDSNCPEHYQCLEFGKCSPIARTVYYRYYSYNDTCSLVYLYSEEVTEDDYDTLEECSANIETPPGEYAIFRTTDLTYSRYSRIEFTDTCGYELGGHNAGSWNGRHYMHPCEEVYGDVLITNLPGDLSDGTSDEPINLYDGGRYSRYFVCQNQDVGVGCFHTGYDPSVIGVYPRESIDPEREVSCEI